jgi:hypothetical protein
MVHYLLIPGIISAKRTELKQIVEDAIYEAQMEKNPAEMLADQKKWQP